jgi:hypothetical protein
MATEVSTLEAPATTKKGAPRPAKTYTVGSYLAARFTQIGLKHHFAKVGRRGPMRITALGTFPNAAG